MERPNSLALNFEFIKFRKLSEFGKEPSKGTPKAAGYDLFSAKEKKVPPHSVGFVSSNIMLIKY